MGFYDRWSTLSSSTSDAWLSTKEKKSCSQFSTIGLGFCSVLCLAPICYINFSWGEVHKFLLIQIRYHWQTKIMILLKYNLVNQWVNWTYVQSIPSKRLLTGVSVTLKQVHHGWWLQLCSCWKAKSCNGWIPRWDPVILLSSY